MPGRCSGSVLFVGLIAALLNAAAPRPAAADEAGVSFWLPGQYASFAAELATPGWSFEATFYHATASASGSATFPQGGRIEAGVKSPTDYVMLTPTYTFNTSVLGGQAALGVTALVGQNTTSVSATLSAPGFGTLSGSQSDRLFGLGDLTPTATLKWNRGAHNVMLYGMANVPVGAYDPRRLAAMGLGHWSVDGGAGYTYYDEEAGIEFSAVVGVTYNFTNPDTQYRSGNDAHLDWAFSPYVSDTMHLGIAGYFYSQLSGDSGVGATLGPFKSKVAGIGPQIGFFFPVGDREGYFTVRGYYEFEAENRLAGWNAFVTFSVDAPEPASPKSVPEYFFSRAR